MSQFARIDVTNNAQGPRGLYTKDGYVELAPGETRKGLEISEAEFLSAKGTGYFSFAEEGTPPDNDGDGKPGGSLPRNVPKLKKIAKEEDIDLGDATTVDAITAVILEARAAKLAGTSGSQVNDDLDRLDDETLRTTVQAITGQPAPESADRETLLRLARHTTG